MAYILPLHLETHPYTPYGHLGAEALCIELDFAHSIQSSSEITGATSQSAQLFAELLMTLHSL